MGETTKIEWCDATFNPWIGCQKVSLGCDHCYAEALMDTRWGKVEWGPHGKRVRTSESNWKLPLRWAKAARNSIQDHRPRVFCASLADVFDNRATPEWRTDLFALIEDTPELDWLLLTKRPENVAKMLWPKWDAGLPFNIWMGTTAEDQEHYDRRWAILSKIPAKVRFISYEPAIGKMLPGGSPYEQPDWIICGGESGHGARTMDPQWARDLRDDCDKLGISFFMKQMTGKSPIPADLLVRQFPNSKKMETAA
jgi:protein gp37